MVCRYDELLFKNTYYNTTNLTYLLRMIQNSPVIYGNVPANFQIPTKLCTDLPKGMNKLFTVGDIFFTLGKTQEGHAHLTVGKF